MSDITPEEIAELRTDAAAHLATSRATEAEREVVRQRRLYASQGTARIVAERLRQVEAEGWTPEHDQEHDDGALAKAAACYVQAALITQRAPESVPGVRRVYERHNEVPEDDEDFRRMLENPARHWYGWDKAPDEWPWDPSWWKPSPDVVSNLVKAGALIAAEIDRLLASPSAAQEGSSRTEGDGPDA